MFSQNSPAFSMIQQILAIWSLVPLPFLNPACTSGNSWFMYCWSLAWKILSIYWHVKWAHLYDSLNILWHCLSLGLEWKLTVYLLNFWIQFVRTLRISLCSWGLLVCSFLVMFLFDSGIRNLKSILTFPFSGKLVLFLT